jgi:hypothetical protein
MVLSTASPPSLLIPSVTASCTVSPRRCGGDRFVVAHAGDAVAAEADYAGDIPGGGDVDRDLKFILDTVVVGWSC